VDRSPLAAATVVSLVVALALMIPFDSTAARAGGVAAMAAFIVCGVFLIARPGFLDRDG
jgi:uncharacterized membrane protein YkgB